MQRKTFGKILTLYIAATLLVCALFGITVSAQELSEDIVILYTNDVHTYIDGKLSYDVIAAVKKDLQKQYKYVFLVDAGDHIQGTAYGSMDNGENIIKMMNAAGYDVATLGNHEFDYGTEGCFKAVDLADFPYVSANFYNVKDGERTQNILDSYVMFDCGAEKVAFVGITTPETFEKSTSAYFRDQNGNFIYGISGGKNGEALCADVQNAVNEAKAAGATKVIALGHLGIDMSSQPWTSAETIAKTEGIDAFIDGHSHSTVKGKAVDNKNGESVVLTQTGSYFDRIGIMKIEQTDGKITTDFIEYGQDGNTEGLVSEIYGNGEIISDSAVKEIKDGWIEEIDRKLGEKIGFADVVFDNYDSDGNRLVRTSETNSGDFSADALYYLFDNMDMDVDVAIMNGGGIRNTAISGDISYKTCKDMHTFGNVACLQKVTGRQILDALEWGTRKLGIGESGGFLHVSGLTYKVNTAVPNTVAEDELGTWVGGPEKYRVYDVMVYDKKSATYKELDPNANYSLAGYNYTLRNLGDGYAMFDGAVNVLDYVMEDYMVLANYIKGFENGTVGAENSPLLKKYPGFKLNYADVHGSGRIQINDNAQVTSFEDVAETDWFYPYIDYVYQNGLMKGAEQTLFAPNDNLTRAMLVTVLYRAEGEPESAQAAAFTDVSADSCYSAAISWASLNGIVSGITETEFAPDQNITREQIAAIVYRYAEYKKIAPTGAWAIKLDYSDISEISDYAAEGVMYCTLKGIMQGNENNSFAPSSFATRAEAAAILCRIATA